MTKIPNEESPNQINKALELSNFLTFRLARVQAKLNAQGARLLRDIAGLTLTQWRIIFLIARSDELRSSEITRAFEIDKGLLSRNLKNLTSTGLVKAESDANDHRAQVLTLTEKGHALFYDTLPHMQRRQEGLRNALSGEELQNFLASLEKIENTLE